MWPLESSLAPGRSNQPGPALFHSAGTDSSYWAWGAETKMGSDVLVPEEGNYCFSNCAQMYWKCKENDECKPEVVQHLLWPSAVEVLCRLVREINGLKSNSWAIHYPPTNHLSSLAPPKLHINLKKVTHFSSTITLVLPCSPLGPIKPKYNSQITWITFVCLPRINLSFSELHNIHYLLLCHAARVLHLGETHSSLK